MSHPWYRDFTRFVQLKGLKERSRLSYYGWVRQLDGYYPDGDLPALPAAGDC